MKIVITSRRIIAAYSRRRCLLAANFGPKLIACRVAALATTLHGSYTIIMFGQRTHKHAEHWLWFLDVD